MSRTPVESLNVVRAKFINFLDVYVPLANHAGRDLLAEHEAAVREDENDAIKFAAGAPLVDSALDTSEADAIEPVRESTPEEIAAIPLSDTPPAPVLPPVDEAPTVGSPEELQALADAIAPVNEFVTPPVAEAPATSGKKSRK